MTNFDRRRPIASYGKIQRFVSRIIRNRRAFISSAIGDRKYLDIGCGPNSSRDFVNLDYDWQPGIDVCWDLTRAGLPFPGNRFLGVYSEHCLEHIPMDDFKKVAAEIHRVLKPGGVFRMVVPDGEIYLDIYQERKQGGTRRMPYEETYISPMHRINGIFRNYGHQFIYDFATVKLLLAEAGFTDITKERFGQGRIKELIRDSQHREHESLYVEAVK
jgi:predicted SAM-dependent methyltransferase